MNKEIIILTYDQFKKLERVTPNIYTDDQDRLLELIEVRLKVVG